MIKMQANIKQTRFDEVNWINFHCGDNEASCFTATRNVMNK
jgi:hypothetical protein